jgi:hypothetical protein
MFETEAESFLRSTFVCEMCGAVTVEDEAGVSRGEHENFKLLLAAGGLRHTKDGDKWFITLHGADFAICPIVGFGDTTSEALHEFVYAGYNQGYTGCDRACGECKYPRHGLQRHYTIEEV